MKALNLLLLSRTHDTGTFSMLYHALSCRKDKKTVSEHEAASVWSLTDRIAAFLAKDSEDGSWLSLLDGFYFSYVIEHIGKEFDLLKIARDGSCILNIELKSEMTGEERIKKQLEQNRYYLSHIAGTIYSFTYVMETGQLYQMNEKGYLKTCELSDLAAALKKKALADSLDDGIDSFFKAAEYLISPIASPEEFLQGRYFLTNQQFDFRRRILSYLQEGCDGAKSPVISISGIAGTGKTLLLLDLGVQLSRKHRVLFIHSGPLRRGHLLIDQRLKHVDIIGKGQAAAADLSGYDYLLIDEADYLEEDIWEALLDKASIRRIPVILAYDPHELLTSSPAVKSAAQSSPESTTQSSPSARFAPVSTLQLAFSGNVRINRPVYSFLRTLLRPADRSGRADYSCIDVVYANDRTERKLLEEYYKKKGYVYVSMAGGDENEEAVIAREYDKVFMVLDNHFYYDEAQHLRCSVNEEEALRLLYEGLSRTRENLCLLVCGNIELFEKVLSVKLGSL